MEINHFASFNPEVEHDVSGTCSKPILVAIVPGKRGTGAMFIIKIKELYYEMQKNRDGKQWWTIRCSKAKSDKCYYSVRIINRANLKPEDRAVRTLRRIKI